MVSRGEDSRTHISVVFFLADQVYKLKKPLDLSFVDLRSLEARESICHREVTLNRGCLQVSTLASHRF